MQPWAALVYALALLTSAPLTIGMRHIPETPRPPIQRVLAQIAKSLLVGAAVVPPPQLQVSAAVLPPQISIPDFFNTADVLNIKMERLAEGLLAVNFTVDAMQGPFRAIVDTGSPFLLVPSICTAEWGCENPSVLAAVADPYMVFKIAELLSPTVESFGGQEYDVEWRRGDVKFIGCTAVEPISSRTTFRNVVFGSVGEDIKRRPGGVFCGLIRRRAQEIRPTLLGQLGYDSFAFDAANEVLTLSSRPLIAPTEDAIKIVDLRLYGSPVQHYAAKVKYLFINGQRVSHGPNLFCIIDTGTTGCVLSDDITFNEYTPIPVRTVRVVLQMERGGEVVLEAGADTRSTRSPPFVVSTAFVPWPGFRRPGRSKQDPYIGASSAFLPGPSLVVIGLPFLQPGHSSLLTVDTGTGRMRVE